MNVENINTINTQFPPLFTQARNLLEQAIESGKDVLNGNPLLATPEKAKARFDICETCEFFLKNRCLKCGCFMDKKIHFESSKCPMNKWGSLQTLVVPPDLVNIETFPIEERERISEVSRHLAHSEQPFFYAGQEYTSKINDKGDVEIYKKYKEGQGPKRVPRNITNGFSSDELREFNELVQKSKNTEDKVFSFKGENYKVTVDGNKTNVGFAKNKI